ncbi:MAG TPA: phenylalanine--tRNA ligase subunit beta [Pyrinomonadaceae bacterium]|jgi:phenylalanyl-tRNA synthetase beta chain|nr:phenylalanine--tRNA ligase subunit beta [Pyrinomonadaceae bacterium]
MKISYNWLRELTGVEWTPAELRERLTLRGLEVEGIEEAEGDHVFEIAVLSNRADWLSHLGVAREVGVMTGRGVTPPRAEPTKVEGRATDFASVDLQAPDLCPRFTARVVRGVRIAPSPAWLAERLQAVGLRPINNVADITNFVMLELGQPLHAFDLDKLAERRIVVRRARDGELLKTLDGVERKLDAEMLVIADAARAVAVAGVMGGAETEISDATGNVLIECAYFDPASVRRTSRALGLQTDASDRFERGVDYEGQLRAQARAAALITELAGGAATEDAIDIYPRRIEPPTVPLRFDRVRALTDLDVPPREAIRILDALGFRMIEGGANGSGGGPQAAESPGSRSGKGAQFAAPTWRTDVTLEEDLVEEVARHFGYEKIVDALPASGNVGEHRAHEGQRRAARRALADSGFDEAISFSFIDAAHDDRFESPPGLLADVTAEKGGENVDGVVDARFVALTNPIIEGASRMRATLLPGLLDAVRHNFNHGTRDVRLFEAGRVFAAATESGARPVERESLGLVATGGATEADRVAAPRELDFYDLKGALEAAADAMRLPPLDFIAARARHLREGQSAQVLLGDTAVGWIGRLSDEIGAAYKFRQPVYVAEVNLSALLDAGETPARYAPLPRYPSVARDASLVVDRRATFAEIRRAALALNLENVRGVELVYVYEGERVSEGKRSVTLRVEYRSDERTLRDEEVDAAHRRIVEALENKFVRD